MHKLLPGLMLLLCIQASTQDFCTTTKNLLVAASENFRNQIDLNKRQKNDLNQSYWSTSLSYVAGETAAILENNGDKLRTFRQTLDRKFDEYKLARFQESMSACLNTDWVKERNGNIVWYKNEKLQTYIVIRPGTGFGISIQLEKRRPLPKPTKNAVPFLLNTGAADYLLVDSATMIPASNNVYDLKEHLMNAGFDFNDTLYKYRDHQYGDGFLDRSGKVVIYPRTTEGMYGIRFSEGMAWIKERGYWYFMNTSGKGIISPTYDDIYGVGFYEGLTAYKKLDKWGYVDKAGKRVISAIYETAYPFFQGLAIVNYAGKWGVINKTGDQVILIAYDNLRPASMDSSFIVQKTNKWGIADRKGKEIIIPAYDDIPDGFRGSLCAVQKDKKWGVIDRKGKIVIPIKYTDKLYVFDKLVIFTQNKLYGLMDPTGKQIVPPKYEIIMEFTEGLGAVKKNGKWGFIDKTGKEVIPIKYEHSAAFENGLAVVGLNNKTGVIDKTGKTIVPFVYDAINSFREGLAGVYQNSKAGFLDKTGKVIIPLKYSSVQNFLGTMAIVESEDKLPFYIDREGREYRE